jgi:hypothetical protein
MTSSYSCFGTLKHSLIQRSHRKCLSKYCQCTASACMQRDGGAELLEMCRCTRGTVSSSRDAMRLSSGSSGEMQTAKLRKLGALLCRSNRFSLPTRQLSMQMLTSCTTCEWHYTALHEEHQTINEVLSAPAVTGCQQKACQGETNMSSLIPCNWMSVPPCRSALQRNICHASKH